jgi:hypothetical protein
MPYCTYGEKYLEWKLCRVMNILCYTYFQLTCFRRKDRVGISVSFAKTVTFGSRKGGHNYKVCINAKPLAVGTVLIHAHCDFHK